MIAPIEAVTAERSRTWLRTLFERVLAEESHLAALTHQYEWRVPGAPVQSLKRLFAEQGRQVDAWLAELKTHARRLGIASGALAAPPAGDEADDGCLPAPRAALSGLLAQHRRLARELSTVVEELAARDPNADATSLLKDLHDFHETCAWILGVVLAVPEPCGLARG